jgi:hypothetical protein
MCRHRQHSLGLVTLDQVDPVFEGLDGGEGSLIKYNPLSNLSSAETWNFLRVMVRFPFSWMNSVNSVQLLSPENHVCDVT